jgi:hypothetical protein
MAGTRRTESALDTLFADNTSGDISAQDGRDVITSVHPAKVVQSDTQANEPAAGQLAGDLFLPSNGFQVERYSGSAWQPWGPLFPFTKPVNGDFSWDNQGGASVDTTYGGIYLLGVSGGTQHRLRYKTAPATPYTITTCFLPALGSSGECGLCFRQSSDGKLVIFTITQFSSEVCWSVQKWGSSSSFSAQYGSITACGASANGGAPVWMRIADDGANRICSLSPDGQHWDQACHSVGRTDFLTADQVGITTRWDNAAGFAAMNLLSWKEA